MNRSHLMHGIRPKGRPVPRQFVADREIEPGTIDCLNPQIPPQSSPAPDGSGLAVPPQAGPEPSTFVTVSDYRDGDAPYVNETRLGTSWTDLIAQFERDEAEYVAEVWQWLPHTDVSELLAQTLCERDENHRIDDPEYVTPASVRRWCAMHGWPVEDEAEEPDPYGEEGDRRHAARVAAELETAE